MLKILIKDEDENGLLSKPTKPVIKFSDIKTGISEMLDLMYKNRGAGLSANQVSVPLSFFVMDSNIYYKSPKIFINPEIVERSKKTDILEEGCLSLPKIFVAVKRNKSVVVKYENEKGIGCIEKFTGMDARIIQHELDHLNGILITDKK